MKTIALAAAKGGVAKTTLTAALATAVSLEPPDLGVVILDLDPQGSLTRPRAEPGRTSRRQSMKIVVVAAAKGGVGKTTLVAALATTASLETPDLRVVILDLDPQGSLTRWWNARALGRPELRELARASLRAALERLQREGFDLVFIDCPPGFSTIQRDAIAAADLVLVPAGASALDLTAIASTIEMAERARVPYRTVLNLAVFRSRIAGRAVWDLCDRGSMLWPPIHRRVEHAVAMKSGQTALETQPDGAAAREIAALWRGVRALLEAMLGRRPPDPPQLPRVPIAAGRTGA